MFSIHVHNLPTPHELCLQPIEMSEDSSKRSETEAESQEAESFSTTPSDVRQALKELASAVAKHDDDSSPEVGKALEGLASAVAGREPTEDDRRALVEFASDIGFTVPEEQDPQGKAAAAATQDQTEDCESLLANVTELLEQTAEAVASRQSGQELIRHADSVLKVFELTAVWEQGNTAALEISYFHPLSFPSALSPLIGPGSQFVTICPDSRC